MNSFTNCFHVKKIDPSFIFRIYQCRLAGMLLEKVSWDRVFEDNHVFFRLQFTWREEAPKFIILDQERNWDLVVVKTLWQHHHMSFKDAVQLLWFYLWTTCVLD